MLMCKAILKQLIILTGLGTDHTLNLSAETYNPVGFLVVGIPHKNLKVITCCEGNCSRIGVFHSLYGSLYVRSGLNQ